MAYVAIPHLQKCRFVPVGSARHGFFFAAFVDSVYNQFTFSRYPWSMADGSWSSTTAAFFAFAASAFASFCLQLPETTPQGELFNMLSSSAAHFGIQALGFAVQVQYRMIKPFAAARPVLLSGLRVIVRVQWAQDGHRRFH